MLEFWSHFNVVRWEEFLTYVKKWLYCSYFRVNIKRFVGDHKSRKLRAVCTWFKIIVKVTVIFKMIFSWRKYSYLCIHRDFDFSLYEVNFAHGSYLHQGAGLRVTGPLSYGISFSFTNCGTVHIVL
jgi:hypothetical protein